MPRDRREINLHFDAKTSNPRGPDEAKSMPRSNCKQRSLR